MKNIFKKATLGTTGAFLLWLSVFLLVEIDKVWDWYSYEIDTVISENTGEQIYLYQPKNIHRGGYGVGVAIFESEDDLEFVCKTILQDPTWVLGFCTEMPIENLKYCQVHTMDNTVTKIIAAAECTGQLVLVGTQLKIEEFEDDMSGREFE